MAGFIHHIIFHLLNRGLVEKTQYFFSLTLPFDNDEWKEKKVKMVMEV